MMTLIHGAISPETAHTTDDYPYGRHRTKCRWWIETAAKGSAKGQQRAQQQTLNPKTGQWNKPHPSIYSEMAMLFTDDKGHTHVEHVRAYPTSIMRHLGLPLYAQHNEEERRRFTAIFRFDRRLNRSSWVRFDELITILRPIESLELKTPAELLDTLRAAYPGKPDPYAPDIELVTNAIIAERKAGTLTQFWPVAQPISEAPLPTMPTSV